MIMNILKIVKLTVAINNSGYMSKVTIHVVINVVINIANNTKTIYVGLFLQCDDVNHEL